MTATDSRGLATTVSANAYPRKVDLTFASNPAGRSVVVSGTTYATPVTLTSWTGHGLAVDAPAQTDGAGRSYTFQSWSDGGAAAHTIVSPTTPTTYTATFAESAAPAGLVAAYGFEPASGSAVPDSSGRGNDGTLSGATRSTGGPLRLGAQLRRRQRLGHGAGLGLARPHDRDDRRGVGSARLRSPAGARWPSRSARAGSSTASTRARDRGRSGQVDIGGERNAVGSASLPLNAWSHLATTYDGSVVRLYVNGTLAGSSAIRGTIPASTGVAPDRRELDLDGVVRRPDRRGARLRPRAPGGRDPARHADGRSTAARHRRTATAARHDAAERARRA